MSRPDEGLIHTWLDGELDAAEAARVEALVQSDPAWAAAAAEARGLIAASARIVSALDDVPRGVVPRPAAKSPQPTAAVGRRPTAWWVMRAAAAIVVVAGSALVLSRSDIGGSLAKDEIASAVTAVPSKEKDGSADSARPAEAELRARGSTVSSPVAASPAPGGAGKRDGQSERALADADVRQKLGQDRFTPQAQAVPQPAPLQVQSPQVTQQGPVVTSAGAGASGTMARAESQSAVQSRRDAVQRLDSVQLKQRSDSLQKKMLSSSVNLSQVVTTGVAESTDRRALGFAVAVTPPPAAKSANEAADLAAATRTVLCYRESSTNTVYRAQRLTDSTATLATSPADERDALRSAATAAPGRAAEIQRVLTLRVKADTLFVAGANGTVTRALRVSCPAP